MGVGQTIDITTEERKTIQFLLERHLPSTPAWVYGSRAKWTSCPKSDLDLVVFAAPEHQQQVGTLREAFETSDLPFLVDLFVWRDLPEAFKKQIEADHVVIQPRALFEKSYAQPGIAAEQNWTTFGKCSVLVCDTALPSNLGPVPHIGLEHIGKGTLSLLGYGTANDVTSAKSRFQRGDILFGKVRPHFRKVARASFDGVCSTDIWVVRSSRKVDTGFLYYLMASQEFVDAATQGAEGTRMPRAKWEFVSQLRVLLPPLSEQRKAADILGALDDKINLNRRMNKTLEAMARALFKSWFVDFDPVRAKMEGRDTGLPQDITDLFPDQLIDSDIGEIPQGWKVVSLDSIARFHNGLALQRLHPAQNEAQLPVVTIAQLRAGEANSGEWASATIKPESVIEDGDVVFSWSGGLLIKMWCGGRAALNQHLFRVTSSRYPKWFYLHSLLFHFPKFRRIAQDKATTMGPIRRHHLTEALCVVPPDGVIAGLCDTFGFILERHVTNDLVGRTLAALRDTLLAKLISGEIRVRDAARVLDSTT